jgi:hypothetical protein
MRYESLGWMVARAILTHSIVYLPITRLCSCSIRALWASLVSTCLVRAVFVTRTCAGYDDYQDDTSSIAESKIDALRRKSSRPHSIRLASPIFKYLPQQDQSSYAPLEEANSRKSSESEQQSSRLSTNLQHMASRVATLFGVLNKGRDVRLRIML